MHGPVLVVLIVLSFLQIAHARPEVPHKNSAEKRSHGSHVHGQAKASLAFEGNQGKFYFNGASEALVGFEHEAKTPEDQSRVSQGIRRFEISLPQMLVFDSSLQCQFKREKIDVRRVDHSPKDHSPKKEARKNQKKEAEHSEFIAEFAIECKKSPVGTSLKVQFNKEFPNLDEVELQVLIGQTQTTLKVRKALQTLELK